MIVMRSISGRTDADYVAVVEVFDNLSHAEIHHAVRQLDPATLVGAAEAFLTTATGLGDAVESAHGEIRAAIADGWRGAAAQRASDAVRDFEQAGRRIADVLTAVGVRLSRAGDAAESVRAAIAEPEGTQPDPSAALLDSEQAANNATIAREAENARLDAVRAMETIYAGAFLPTGSGVPAFTGTATETGTVAAGAAGAPPSPGTTPAAASAAITSAPATATTAAATIPTGSSPVVSAGTITTSNGTYPSAATAPVSGLASSATAPAATAPGATAAPGGSLTSAGSASTTPTATTAAAPGAVRVGSRSRTDRRPADGTATGSAAADTETSTAAAVADQGTAASTTSNIEAAGDTRQERDPAMAGGEVAAGMGAGAVGGMMGGAIAAADQARQPGGPRPAAQVEEPEDEDDEFLRYLEEEPTYLEPADEVNALIGKMEPTSPAVLGEWTERE